MLITSLFLLAMFLVVTNISGVLYGLDQLVMTIVLLGLEGLLIYHQCRLTILLLYKLNDSILLVMFI